MITLRKLSEDDSWLIFSQIAFFGRDTSECKLLEEIGRENKQVSWFASCCKDNGSSHALSKY